MPDATNSGRFQYTGQAWLPELAMYYYKARIYSPTLGRFLQTDPIGYDDGPHLYAYVGNDPVNGRDPTGRSCEKNEDKKGVTCKIDEPGSMKGKALDRANAAYTTAVNRLLNSPNRSFSYTNDKQKVTVRAGDVAKVLIGAHVRAAGNSPAMKYADGTEFKANAVTNEPDGPGKGVKILLYSEGISQGSAGLSKTLIHEGMHGLTGEKHVQSTSDFQAAHQNAYKAFADIFYDKYND